MRVVAAPDKFRGTASAAAVAAAVGRAARAAGWSCDEVPMADGGEGTLDALGGPNRTTLVTDALGDPVEAEWRLHRGVAVIESARASGIAMIGGPEENDPISASTYGTGELIAQAVELGARRVIVAVGGSATTDGGLGALRALHPVQRLRGIDIEVATDVRTRFVDAAEHFAPQKGATPAQVELLRRRLTRLAQVYEEDHGVDVRDIEGAGAAGGLAGGLAAIGARIVPGFDLVADELGLDELVEQADLVVTGEGFLDAQSFEGKVVGGVAEMAGELGVPVMAIAGAVYDGVGDRIDAVSLTARVGEERARTEVEALVEEIVAERLAALG
jgi:glycerate kinase